MQLFAGTMAPDFVLPDATGIRHRLSNYRGHWVMLYFYPRDHTPGCTVEACAFRDEYTAFRKLGVVVIGVSTDSAERHRKFSEKYALSFPLLADTGYAVVQRYGVWGKKKFFGKTYQGTQRVSFLINPDGIIAKVYSKVQPFMHAQEVLADVRAFSRS